MINFSAQPKLTPRRVRRSTIVRMQCAGEFCFSGAVDQDAVKAKIVTAKAALDQDYQDLVMLHSDGTTESPYKLESGAANNATGNIVYYQNWPSTAPEDYATTKQFQFGVEAEFYDPNLSLLDFSQSIRITGTTGPIKRWIRLLDGTWQSRVIHTSSTKRIIQEGRALGFGAYPVEPPPILAEIYEHLDQRQIFQEGPSIFYSRPYEYLKTWRYVFETPLEFTPLNVYPLLR
ncbi:MAG: hypothetical protein CMK32_10040 [Porticoccaceae bacterium]|nr:hypothetical protein [Porticoccaceae bacterium]